MASFFEVLDRIGERSDAVIPSWLSTHPDPENREEAIAAFKGLNRPVVVKIAAADIAHKTEAGGVILNVPDTLDIGIGQDRLADLQTHVFTATVQIQQVGARTDQ